jgi:hypothetical protein
MKRFLFSGWFSFGAISFLVPVALVAADPTFIASSQPLSVPNSSLGASVVFTNSSGFTPPTGAGILSRSANHASGILSRSVPSGTLPASANAQAQATRPRELPPVSSEGPNAVLLTGAVSLSRPNALADLEDPRRRRGPLPVEQWHPKVEHSTGPKAPDTGEKPSVVLVEDQTVAEIPLDGKNDEHKLELEQAKARKIEFQRRITDLERVMQKVFEKR